MENKEQRKSSEPTAGFRLGASPEEVIRVVGTEAVVRLAKLHQETGLSLAALTRS
jgi:hypothetical protein